MCYIKTIPHHTAPYHTTPHHTIPYHQLDYTTHIVLSQTISSHHTIHSDRSFNISNDTSVNVFGYPKYTSIRLAFLKGKKSCLSTALFRSFMKLNLSRILGSYSFLPIVSHISPNLDFKVAFMSSPLRIIV